MKYLRIENKCRVCKSENLKKVIKLKPSPINELYENNYKKSLTHKKFPQTVARCKDCSHIQIIETINSKYMWKKYTYYSAQNNEVIKHFRKFSSKIKKKINLRNKLVIDIGCGDGSLLNNFKKNSITLGIEPSKNVSKIAKKMNINIINQYFNDNVVKLVSKKYNKAKLILAFNVFAHTSSVYDFINRVKKILDKDGYFIFEAQYLGYIYKRFILGTFFHEHMSHHSITNLYKVFKRFNLKLIKVERNENQNGSIIGYVVNKDSKFTEDKSVKKILQYEKSNNINTLKTLLKFRKKIFENRQLTKKIIKNYNKYYGYGSARSGPIYCENYGVKFPKIVFDNHKDKVNKFIPHYGSKIYPLSSLKKLNKNLIIILAYVYSKKIIKKNIQNIKKGLEFLVFYPRPKIINSKNYKKYLNG